MPAITNPIPTVFPMVRLSRKKITPPKTAVRITTAGTSTPKRENSSLVERTKRWLNKCPKPFIDPATKAIPTPQVSNVLRLRLFRANGARTATVAKLIRKAPKKGSLIPLFRITSCQPAKQTPTTIHRARVLTVVRPPLLPNCVLKQS